MHLGKNGETTFLVPLYQNVIFEWKGLNHKKRTQVAVAWPMIADVHKEKRGRMSLIELLNIVIHSKFREEERHTYSQRRKSQAIEMLRKLKLKEKDKIHRETTCTSKKKGTNSHDF